MSGWAHPVRLHTGALFGSDPNGNGAAGIMLPFQDIGVDPRVIVQYGFPAIGNTGAGATGGYRDIGNKYVFSLTIISGNDGLLGGRSC